MFSWLKKGRNLRQARLINLVRFNADIVLNFSEHFCVLTDGWAYDATTVDQLNDFNYICNSVLDSVAPGKIKPRSLANKVSWINEDIRILKRKCLGKQNQAGNQLDFMFILSVGRVNWCFLTRQLKM